MSDRPAALMLFAAGLGTRMGALTADRPKPLIAVAGRPLIDHALAVAEEAGIDRIVVNTHYRADQLAAHLAGRPGIRLSHEAGEVLETGGGLRHALPLIGAGPVFTMNTDAVWTGPNPLVTLARAWQPDRMDALLLTVPRDRATGHKGRGDFLRDPDGRLTPGPGDVYTGAQIIRTDRLERITDRVFSLWRLWTEMIAEGRLYGVEHPGGWCDVGHPDAIPLAESLLAGAGP
ncbi:MAG: nucleotidyltransferase family protein [Pseudomonadota bacterium]